MEDILEVPDLSTEFKKSIDRYSFRFHIAIIYLLTYLLISATASHFVSQSDLELACDPG
jgi:hypothetical protein